MPGAVPGAVPDARYVSGVHQIVSLALELQWGGREPTRKQRTRALNRRGTVWAGHPGGPSAEMAPKQRMDENQLLKELVRGRGNVLG